MFCSFFPFSSTFSFFPLTLFLAELNIRGIHLTDVALYFECREELNWAFEIIDIAYNPFPKDSLKRGGGLWKEVYHDGRI